MSWQELEKIESYLKENGYRNGGQPYHCNADHYWYKAFGKEDNPYEANRALWQVFINVYDWRRFQYCDPNLKDASITASIHISRTINEVGIKLDWDLTKDGFDLKDIEDKAYKFWRYVEESFGAPPKEMRKRMEEKKTKKKRVLKVKKKDFDALLLAMSKYEELKKSSDN